MYVWNTVKNHQFTEIDYKISRKPDTLNFVGKILIIYRVYFKRPRKKNVIRLLQLYSELGRLPHVRM